MEIFRNNAIIHSLHPADNSTQRVVHMGEDVLNLTFNTTASLDLRVDDHVYFDDKKYKLKKPVNPTKISRNRFEYSCQFYSIQYDFEDALYTLSDSTGVGELNDAIPLFGTLTFHAEQIIRCVCEIHPDWELGETEDFGDGKNIVYNEMDCLQAIQHLAEEFGTEYWFTEDEKLHFGKRSEGSPLLFKYGKGNSLYDLSRINQDGRIVTKLLVSGSSRNIDASTYGSGVLRLPGGEKYVEKNTEKYGVIMGRQKFPDVYPRLIYKNPSDPGCVTSARFANGIYYIKDENLDFNPVDYLLPGMSIKVFFQTGQLGGVKVEANWNNNTKEFELIRGNYGLGMDVPGSIFVPAEGDLYLLEDVKMPEAYITAAENELLQKANEAINQVCEQKVSYKATLNYLYFKYLNDKVDVGRAVQIEDEHLIGQGKQIDLRIQALTRNVNDPYRVDVEISETMYVGRLDKIETTVKDIKEELVVNKPRAGDRGAAIVYRGVYEEIETGELIFYNNRNRRDVVKYEDIYYIYKGADGAPNVVWIEGNWEKFGDQFQAIATELLLAENANVAGWIFRNERLESQSGGAFLDGRTGDVSITGKFKSSRDGNMVVIDPASLNKITFYEENGHEVGFFGFWRDVNNVPYRGNMSLKTVDNNGTILARCNLFPNSFYLTSGNQIFSINCVGSGNNSYVNILIGSLPTSATGLPPGTVYRNGNQLMIAT